MTGLVWEACFKTLGVNNCTTDEVHTMYRNVFFYGTSEYLGESAL